MIQRTERVEPIETSLEEGILFSSPEWYKKSVETRVEFVAKSMPIDGLNPEQSATENYAKARKIVERDEQEVQENLQAVKEAKTVFVPLGPHTARGLNAQQLFFYLGLPDEKLKDVYEYDGSRGFTGRFTYEGKQKLADILGKRVEYFYQTTSEPLMQADSLEIYTPKLSLQENSTG